MVALYHVSRYFMCYLSICNSYFSLSRVGQGRWGNEMLGVFREIKEKRLGISEFFCSGVFVVKETHRYFGILVFRVSSVSLYVS